MRSCAGVLRVKYLLYGKGKKNGSRYTVQPGGGEMKSEIQDAKLKRKNCSSLGVSPLSGGEESGPCSRESLWWSGFLGHSL